MDDLVVILILIIGGGVYFLPSIVAAARDKQNIGAILVLNIFLGWTLIGWVVALVWAVAQESEKQDLIGSRQCPHCAETIKREAKVCRYCGRDLPKEGRGLPDRDDSKDYSAWVRSRILIGIVTLIVFILLVGVLWFFLP